MVTASKYTLVSEISRRTSSMSDSAKPRSDCERRASSRCWMSRSRAGAMGSNDMRRGKLAAVSLSLMYLSLVSPISSTWRVGR